MKKLLAATLLLLWVNFLYAHDSRYEKLIIRKWKIEKENKTILGSFFMLKEGKISIQDENNDIHTFNLDELSKKDQTYALQKFDIIQKINQNNWTHQSKVENSKLNFSMGHYFLAILFLSILGYFLLKLSKPNLQFLVPVFVLCLGISLFGFTTKALRAFKKGSSPARIDSAFAPFKPNIHTFYDASYFYIESKGIPTTHQMMAGISNHGWQQQVPIPQCYIGTNAWPIPLNPTMATSPIPVDNIHFTRGAIAIAVNGIPIFNVYTNTGVDSYLDGQLDSYGGHCGRADDYHYHTAPLHLYGTTNSNLPIAYALDGFPVYGSTEPDGSSLKTLDANHGHLIYDEYHYHGTPTAPYMIARMAGNVTEDATHQLIPQAVAKPVRPSLTPLTGALITSCTANNANNGYKLIYTRNSLIDSIVYSWNNVGLYSFKYYTNGNLDSTKNYNGFVQCTVPNTTGIFEIFEPKIDLSIYPNPVKGKLTILINNNPLDKNCTGIEIYNLNGELFYSTNTVQSTIDVTDIKPGIYLIRFHFNSNAITKKIIIQ